MNGRRWARYALPLLLAGVFLYRRRAAVMNIAAVWGFASAFTLLLSPVCSRLERRGVRTHIAAGMAIGGFLLMILLAVSTFVPYLVAHTLALVQRSIPALMKAMQQIGEAAQRWGLQHIGGGYGEALASAAGGATALVARGGMMLAAQTGRMLFALVVSYYLLGERRRIGGHLLLCVPPHRRAAVLSALMACRNAAMGYVSGMLKTSAFVGAATYLGLLLIGVQDALLLALFMGVFEVLPYMGPVLAAVPIVLSALSQGWHQALLALALVVLVQQVEGSFVSPYFTAAGTSIHPLTALLSVFVLGSLMGVWGILLAVPLTAALQSAAWSLRRNGDMVLTV